MTKLNNSTTSLRSEIEDRPTSKMYMPMKSFKRVISSTRDIYTRRLFLLITEKLQQMNFRGELNLIGGKQGYSNSIFVDIPISELLGDTEDHNHARIRDAVKKLIGCVDGFEGDHEFVYMNVFSSARMAKYSNVITIEAREPVVNFLLSNLNGYRAIDKYVMLQLHCSYAPYFYSLVADPDNRTGDIIFLPIDSLREIFGLKNGYASTNAFIKKVIQASKDDLDSYSPWSFEYEVIKESKEGSIGRPSITGIRLVPVFIEENESKAARNLRLDPYTYLNKEYVSILKTRYGFTSDGIRNNALLLLVTYNYLNKERLFEVLDKDIAAAKNRPAYAVDRLYAYLNSYCGISFDGGRVIKRGQIIDIYAGSAEIRHARLRTNLSSNTASIN